MLPEPSSLPAPDGPTIDTNCAPERRVCQFDPQRIRMLSTVNFACVNNSRKGATMTVELSSRRAILLGGFALVVAAAPAVAAVAPALNAPDVVAECPAGYVLEPTSQECVSGEAQNAPSAIPGNPAMPEVDGIPCTGANTGECIGLQESQGGSGPLPIP
jgi:hypothetical protein